MTQMTYGIYENEYGRDYIYPGDRMYVHTSVYLPSSDIDLRTGFLKPDNPRRGRTQAKMLEYVHLDKEYKQLDAVLKARREHPGRRVSLRFSISVIASAIFFFGILLLIQQGRLSEKQQAVDRVYKCIAETQKTNEGLEWEIAEASNSATVCYAAVRKLNMIPGEAVEAIHLVAMDTRPLEAKPTPQETHEIHEEVFVVTQNHNASPPVNASAAETTAIPVIASAEIR